MTTTTQPITPPRPSGTATPQALHDATAAVAAINMGRNLKGSGSAVRNGDKPTGHTNREHGDPLHERM